MSTHEVKVVKLPDIQPHPNAERLGLVNIWAYTVVVGLSDWKAGDLAAYIEPDYVVPDTPEFAFLDGHRRIKVKKLRGIYSQGLLIPAPPGTQEGDNVMELLGITRWEPPIASEPSMAKMHGISVKDPNVISTPIGVQERKYDVESWHKYGNLLIPGETVIITEKLHGSNGRYVFVDGEMYAGSRSNWYKEDPEKRGWWWTALRNNPWIEEWCRKHPTCTLYGEIYGVQNGFHYDTTPENPIKFRAFDILLGGGMRDAHCTYGDLTPLTEDQLVPLIHKGPYNPTLVQTLAEGQSTLNDKHVREGVVVSAFSHHGPRMITQVKLKCVGNGYYALK